MGWTRPSQPFQSPTTRTARAEGAHTANAVPSAPWWHPGVGAEHRPEALVAALADQVDVEVAERGPEAPGLDDRVLAAAVPSQRR